MRRCANLGIAGALALILGWSGGCASRPKIGKADATRVVRAAPPEERSGGLDPLPEDKWWGKYVGAPASAFRIAGNAAFAEARAAYWDGDTPRALEWLRQAHALGGLREERFHELVLQCYERDDRWAESLPLYAELGIEEKRRGWFEGAKKQAARPRLTVEVAPGTTVVPCTLLRGEWVVVDVSVNGVKGRAVLDTGAQTDWWTDEFARRAGLTKLGERGTTNDSHGAMVEMEFASADEVRVGGITARNSVAAVGRSAIIAEMGVDGIVGWDVLKRAHLVFDFPARCVEVSAPAGGVVADAAVGGRLGPIFLARSMEGKPLHLFYDSGAASDMGGVDLYENDGLIRTKVNTGTFRLRTEPVTSDALNSKRRDWPREAAPFSFWLAGYRFETPVAHLKSEEVLHDGWSYLDGVIGNASFLRGRLTLCGVRRLVAFEPATAPQ